MTNNEPERAALRMHKLPVAEVKDKITTAMDTTKPQRRSVLHGSTDTGAAGRYPFVKSSILLGPRELVPALFSSTSVCRFRGDSKLLFHHRYPRIEYSPQHPQAMNNCESTIASCTSLLGRARHDRSSYEVWIEPSLEVRRKFTCIRRARELSADLRGFGSRQRPTKITIS